LWLPRLMIDESCSRSASVRVFSPP
jgi:hypothetical protein